MTIKDIARLSGCGVATVSRVLNNHPDVSRETRRRVMAVVDEQGFQPNTNAKHLKQQAGSSIAIIVKGTQNMLFADLVERIQALLREADRDASVYYLDEDADEVAYALQLCRERKPAGIMFLGGDRKQFRSQFQGITIPCVLLTNIAGDLGFDNLSSVTTDDREASRQAVRFLASRGHREFAGIFKSDDAQGPQRYHGALAAVRDEGLPIRDRRFAWYDSEDRRRLLEEKDGRVLTDFLQNRLGDATAVICYNDEIAFHLVQVLLAAGRRVPEDVSVVGYDGVPISDYLVPRLATVRQDTQLLAQRGMELLLRSIRRPDSSPVHDVVSFRLIPGESVADLI